MRRHLFGHTELNFGPEFFAVCVLCVVSCVSCVVVFEVRCSLALVQEKIAVFTSSYFFPSPSLLASFVFLNPLPVGSCLHASIIPRKSPATPPFRVYVCVCVCWSWVSRSNRPREKRTVSWAGLGWAWGSRNYYWSILEARDQLHYPFLPGTSFPTISRCTPPAGIPLGRVTGERDGDAGSRQKSAGVRRAVEFFFGSRLWCALRIGISGRWIWYSSRSRGAVTLLFFSPPNNMDDPGAFVKMMARKIGDDPKLLRKNLDKAQVGRSIDRLIDWLIVY